jgi:hypothetical protein
MDVGGFGSWSPVGKFFTDTVPPVSAVAPLGAFTSTADFTVAWSGTDDSSGIAGYDIVYTDGSNPPTQWQTGVQATAAVFHGADGHTYSFYSMAVDRAANREEMPAAADASTTVDTTPPTSRMVSLSPYQSRTEFQLTWSGRDATSGIRSYDVYLATGDSPFEVWQKDMTRSSATFEGIEGQEYSFYTLATDNAGNVEPAPGPDAIVKVKIDLCAPYTQVRTGAPSFGQEPVFVSAATPIYLDGSDGFAGVEDTFFRIDDRAPITYKTGIREGVAGPHNMTFWSEDRAGNLETQGSFWFWVDGDSPATSIIFDGPSFQGASCMFVTAQTTIFLAAEDASSGVSRTECKLDGGNYRTFTTAFSVATPGSHALLYRSIDRVGNTEPERKLQLTVDTAPPNTRATTPSGSSGETITVSLSASDEGSGVGATFFRVVAQGERPGDFQEGRETEVEASGDHSLDGDYTVQYYSVDNLNNAERIRECRVRIDTSVTVRLENPAAQSVGTSLYVIEGRTEPGSTVMVNDKKVTVSADGSFFDEVELHPGSNNVVLTITDTAGNSITRKISVTYNEPLSQASWLMPLLALAVVAVLAGILVTRRVRRRRPAALEEMPPEGQA